VGIEDYAPWLRLADRGARFLVLEDLLVECADAPRDRLSTAHIRRQVAVADLAARRWLRAPLQPPRARAAARESVKAARFVLGRALGR
jgi:hypothetical protein